MSGLLFVIAPEADHKIINQLLLYIRDWEYGALDSFRLVNTKNAYDLEGFADGDRTIALEATAPPVPVDFENAWAGASLKDVEDYCLDLDRGDFEDGGKAHLFVVVDSQGVQDKTCIIGERMMDYENEPITFPERFKKLRLPWDETYLTWCNLNIANMNFEEFTEEADVEYEDTLTRQWWTYHSVGNGPELSKENRRRRDAEIAELREDSRA